LSGEANKSEIATLLARLGTRLGRERITRFGVRDTHIPEAASYDISALITAQPSKSEPGISSQSREPPQRPLLMFDPPMPITVLAEVPDGPPYRFRWRRNLHQVVRHEGPERIALPWWRGDGYDRLTRDYYRVEDDEGRRFWLFRHGLYTEKTNPDWYVHGLFA
jgi:protein ImuB